MGQALVNLCQPKKKESSLLILGNDEELKDKVFRTFILPGQSKEIEKNYTMLKKGSAHFHGETLYVNSINEKRGCDQIKGYKDSSSFMKRECVESAIKVFCLIDRQDYGCFLSILEKVYHDKGNNKMFLVICENKILAEMRSLRKNRGFSRIEIVSKDDPDLFEGDEKVLFFVHKSRDTALELLGLRKSAESKQINNNQNSFYGTSRAN